MSAPFGFRDVDRAEKPALVRGVFERVARRYDVMNDLMSLGAHRLWKDAAAVRLNPQPGEVIIDCAGGTGDLARRIVRLARGAQRRRGGAAAKVLALDLSEPMLRAGRTRRPEPEIAWCVGDAQALPLACACADAYVIGFGLRNVADIPAALAEARRVLRPGGRFLCLEFSRLKPAALRPIYDSYSFQVIPRLGGGVAGDAEAYRYLVESIRRFPDQRALAALIGEAGFEKVSFVNFAAGVVALHQGWAI
ncbi:MAG TPA: class I SAM-dependent methyltransferase [Caulobacteraceae bacterium]|nr:class I SAM-dependent methyltransferase [Caulobacteraceae bacterium]